MAQFIAHWLVVNASLEAGRQRELILRDGSTLKEFARVHAELKTLLRKIREVSARQRQVQQERDTLERELRTRLQQFRNTVLQQLLQMQYEEQVRVILPAETSTPRYLGQINAVTRLWEELESNAPFSLGDGDKLDDFRRDGRRFREGCRTLRETRRAYRGLIQDRAGLCGRIMQRMMYYRCAVRFEREVDRELLVTLPARTPASYRPGQG